MILLETSVLVDYTRSDPKLARLIPTLPAVHCGPARSEVLAGARNPAEEARLFLLLNALPLAATPETVWDALGGNLRTLKRAGLTIPYPDVLIATIGITHNIEVWARDKHFPLMAPHLPALRLFVEPP
ncbi:MAG: PIN domain-containing protein [Gemmataceae bacterium]|nr:PIN domain-containing protein [Gemmataceae bacterium]